MKGNQNEPEETHYELGPLQWNWLSSGQYEHVSKMVAEIGRLLGGWIRQTRG